MKVVITSATEKEVLLVINQFTSAKLYSGNELSVAFHTSGVGLLATCFSITKLIYEQKPDLIIQAGIAGALDETIQLGKVVVVEDDRLGDTGVEEEGIFKDIFDMGLQQKNQQPFIKGKLVNPWLENYNLPGLDKVSAITISEVTTRAERIEQLKNKYQAQIETMEGAALHYCCLLTNTPFIQLRATSNYIGERNKAKWEFEEAFENLAATVLSYLDQLHNLK